MKQTAIVGLGNTIMGDDGIGLAVLEHLKEDSWIVERVDFIEGGTSGLMLIPYLKDYPNMFFLKDAQNSRKKLL